MLSHMRDASKSWLVYVAFGILILVFVFYFGPQTEGCEPSRRETAAVVNGTQIENTDISILLNRVTRRNQRVEDGEYIKLQKQVLEKLSLLYLLSDEARESGLEVSPEELSAFILDGRRNPDYSYYSDKDGKFDAESYDRFIQYGLEVTIEQYEAFKGRELMARKYLAVLEQTLTPLPAEIEQDAAQRNTKVDLEFVRIDPKQLEATITFSDQEVKDWAASHGDDLKKYYDEHKAEFETKKRVRVRRLMVKKAGDSAPEPEKKTSEANWAAAKDRVLTKKEDFEAVVKEISEDIAYKDKGGDMGWSQLDDMNQDMARIVSAMKPGEVQEYTSPFANFLLKLEEAEEAKTSTLAEVTDTIARKLLTEQEAKTRIDDIANKLLAAAQAAPDKPLEEVLKIARPAPPAPPVPAAPQEGEPAAPKEGEPAAPVEGEPAAVEGEKKDEPEAPKTPWDELRAANTGPFTKAPRQSYKFDQETKKIVPTRLPWSDVPRIGQDKDLAVAAFDGLTTEKPVYGKVYKNDKDGALFIIRLKERTAPKPEEKDKNLDQSANQMRAELRNDWLGTWQTIVYNPAVELKEVSPWLQRYWDEAIRTGKVEMDTEVFGSITPEAPAPSVEATPGAPTPAGEPPKNP
jgi:parvulin-like peptidyl-prolyl isomerase